MLPYKIVWTTLLWGSISSQYASAFDYQKIPRPIPVERESRPLLAKQSSKPVQSLEIVYKESQKPKSNSLRSEPSLSNQDRNDKMPRPLSGSSFILPATAATEPNLLPSGNTIIDNRYSMNREELQSEFTTIATPVTTKEPMSLDINNTDDLQTNQTFLEETLNTTDSPPGIPLVTIPVTVSSTPEATTLKLILETEKATESSNNQEYNYVFPHHHLHSIFTEADERVLINGEYYCPCISRANLKKLSKPTFSEQNEFEDIEIKFKTAVNSQKNTSSGLTYDSSTIEASTPNTKLNVIVKGYTKDIKNNSIDGQPFQTRDFKIQRPVFSRNENVILNSSQYAALNYTIESDQKIKPGNEESLSPTALPVPSIEFSPNITLVNIQQSNNNDSKFIPRPGSSNLAQSVESEKVDSVSSIASKSVSDAVNIQQSNNNDFKFISRPGSDYVTQSIESEKTDSVSSIESKSVSNVVNIQQSNNNDYKFLPRPGSSYFTQSTLSATDETEVKPIIEINSLTTEASVMESETYKFFATSTEEKKLHNEMNSENISVGNKETLAQVAHQQTLDLKSNHTSDNNTANIYFIREISKQESDNNDQSTSSINGNMMATKASISEKTSQFASRRLHELPRPIPSSQLYQPVIMIPTITTTTPPTPIVIPPGFAKLDNGAFDSSDNFPSQSNDILSTQGIEIINPNVELDTRPEFDLGSENSQYLEPMDTASDTEISSNVQETSSDVPQLDVATQKTEFTPPIENEEDSVSLNTPKPMDFNLSRPTSSFILVPEHSTASQQPTFSLLDENYCSLDGNGLFASEDDCESYIRCHEGVATKMNCPKGLVFNPNITSCDWPQSVPTCYPTIFKDFVCPALQFDEEEIPLKDTINFRYEDSCDLYIACHMSKPRLLRCDPGLSFDATLGRCIQTELVHGCSKQNDNFSQRIY